MILIFPQNNYKINQLCPISLMNSAKFYLFNIMMFAMKLS